MQAQAQASEQDQAEEHHRQGAGTGTGTVTKLPVIVRPRRPCAVAVRRVHHLIRVRQCGAQES